MTTKELNTFGADLAETLYGTSTGESAYGAEQSRLQRLEQSKQEKLNRLSQNSNLSDTYTMLEDGTLESNANKVWNQYTPVEMQSLLGEAVSSYGLQQGNDGKLRYISTGEEYEGDVSNTSRLYNYGTNGEADSKWGIAGGFTGNADERYIEGSRPNYGWAPGTEGVALDSKRLDVLLPTNIAKTIEGIIHGNRGNLEHRTYRSGDRPANVGAGYTEYYGQGVLGDTSNATMEEINRFDAKAELEKLRRDRGAQARGEEGFADTKGLSYGDYAKWSKEKGDSNFIDGLQAFFMRQAAVPLAYAQGARTPEELGEATRNIKRNADYLAGYDFEEMGTPEKIRRAMGASVENIANRAKGLVGEGLQSLGELENTSLDSEESRESAYPSPLFDISGTVKDWRRSTAEWLEETGTSIQRETVDFAIKNKGAELAGFDATDVSELSAEIDSIIKKDGYIAAFGKAITDMRSLQVLAQSIPEMIALGASVGTMSIVNANHNLDVAEYNKGEELTSGEKAMSAVTSVVATYLDRLGDKLALSGMTPAKQALKEAVGKAPTAVKKQLESTFGKGILTIGEAPLRLTGAALVEGATEYLQTLGEEAAQNVSVFTDGFTQEQLDEANVAGVLGAAMGGQMATPRVAKDVLGGSGQAVKGAVEKVKSKEVPVQTAPTSSLGSVSTRELKYKLRDADDVVSVLGSDIDAVKAIRGSVAELVAEGELTEEVEAKLAKVSPEAVSEGKELGKELAAIKKNANEVSKEVSEGARGFLTYYEAARDAELNNDAKALEENITNLENFITSQRAKLGAFESAERVVMAEWTAKAEATGKNLKQLYMEGREQAKGKMGPKYEYTYGTGNTKSYVPKLTVLEKHLSNDPEFKGSAYKYMNMIRDELVSMDRLHSTLVDGVIQAEAVAQPVAEQVVKVEPKAKKTSTGNIQAAKQWFKASAEAGVAREAMEAKIAKLPENKRAKATKLMEEAIKEAEPIEKLAKSISSASDSRLKVIKDRVEKSKTLSKQGKDRFNKLIKEREKELKDGIVNDADTTQNVDRLATKGEAKVVEEKKEKEEEVKDSAKLAKDFLDKMDNVKTEDELEVIFKEYNKYELDFTEKEFDKLENKYEKTRNRLGYEALARVVEQEKADAEAVTTDAIEVEDEFAEALAIAGTVDESRFDFEATVGDNALDVEFAYNVMDSRFDGFEAFSDLSEEARAKSIKLRKKSAEATKNEDVLAIVQADERRAEIAYEIEEAKASKDAQRYKELREELNEVNKVLAKSNNKFFDTKQKQGIVGKGFSGTKLFNAVFKPSKLTGISITEDLDVKDEVKELESVLADVNINKTDKLMARTYGDTPAQYLIRNADGSINERAALAISAAKSNYILNLTGSLSALTLEDVEQRFTTLGEDALTDLGNATPYRFEVETIGADILNNLGIRVGSDISAQYEAGLKADLGSIVLKMLENEGKVEIATVTDLSGKNINAVKLGESLMLSDDVSKAKMYETKYGIDYLGGRTYRLEKPRGFRKVDIHNEPFTDATEEQAGVIRKLENMEYALNDGFDVLTEIFDVNELKAFLGKGQEFKSKAMIDAQVSRDREIDIHVDSLVDLARLKTPDGKNASIWFKWNLVKNRRYNLDSTTINPQNAKLHRFLVTAKSAEFDVSEELIKDINGKAESREAKMFKYGIVQAFDGVKTMDIPSIDKKNSAKVLEAADKLLAMSKDELIELVRANPKIAHIGHTAVAIANIEKLKAGKPFTSTLTVEFDGLTNGFAFSVLQFPQTGFKTWLERIGVLLKSSKYFGQTSMADVKASGFLDTYESLNSDVKYPDVNTIYGSSSLNRQVYDKLLPDISDRSVARNLMKSPVMVFNYGAGIPKIKENIIESLTKEAFEKLAEHPELMERLGVSKLGLATLDLSSPYMTDAVKTVASVVERIYAEPIAEALERVFKPRIALNGAMSEAFNAMYDVMMERMQEKINATKGKGVLLPSSDKLVEIVRETIKEVGPIIDGPTTQALEEGLLIGARATMDVGTLVGDSKQNSVGSSAKDGLGASLVIRTIGSPGAAGNVIPIHNMDATTIGRAIVDTKGGFLGVHDAMVIGIGQESSVESYNKHWYDLNKEYSVLEEIIIAAKKSGVDTKALETLADEIKANRKALFEAEASIGQMVGIPDSMYSVSGKDSVEEAPPAVLEETKVDTNKAKNNKILKDFKGNAKSVSAIIKNEYNCKG